MAMHPNKNKLHDPRYDPAEWEYSYDELAKSQMHDEIRNAAQTQLRDEGSSTTA